MKSGIVVILRQHYLLFTRFCGCFFFCVNVSKCVFLDNVFPRVCNLLCFNKFKFNSVRFKRHILGGAQCCKCEFAEAANNSRLFFFFIRPVTFVSSENSVSFSLLTDTLNGGKASFKICENSITIF